MSSFEGIGIFKMAVFNVSNFVRSLDRLRMLIFMNDELQKEPLKYTYTH